MRFLFDPEDSPEAELKAVFAGQIRYAIRCLQAYPDREVEGLHYARRCIKKLRSLLRLLPKSKVRPLRCGLNRKLQLAARHCSEHRDREVLAGIMDQWQKHASIENYPHADAAIAKLRQHYLEDGEIHAPLEPSLKASVIRRLRASGEEFQAADLEGIAWDDLSLAASRRRLKMERCCRDYVHHPNVENLHEWRKQLKNSLFQSLLLAKVIDPDKKDLSRDMRLEKKLGNVRDLDLLQQTVRGIRRLPLSVAETGDILALAEEEKVKELHSVLKLGSASMPLVFETGR